MSPATPDSAEPRRLLECVRAGDDSVFEQLFAWQRAALRRLTALRLDAQDPAEGLWISVCKVGKPGCARPRMHGAGLAPVAASVSLVRDQSCQGLGFRNLFQDDLADDGQRDG
jgi:hypothetical protein